MFNAFFGIEKNGIKADKNCYIEYYKDKLTNPEYNLYKGKLYTQYNLYTTTSRPSNTFNNINFAALNKDNGERKCYKPEFDKFVEFTKNLQSSQDMSVLLTQTYGFSEDYFYEKLAPYVWAQIPR